jgi:hypothetical protein
MSEADQKPLTPKGGPEPDQKPYISKVQRAKALHFQCSKSKSLFAVLKPSPLLSKNYHPAEASALRLVKEELKTHCMPLVLEPETQIKQ